MTQRGVPTSYTGGALRVQTELRDQMDCLFSCALAQSYVVRGHERWTARLITEADVRCLDPRDPEGTTFREWEIQIGKKLFGEILNYAVLVHRGTRL